MTPTHADYAIWAFVHRPRWAPKITLTTGKDLIDFAINERARGGRRFDNEPHATADLIRRHRARLRRYGAHELDRRDRTDTTPWYLRYLMRSTTNTTRPKYAARILRRLEERGLAG